jgi:hypothetical protein
MKGEYDACYMMTIESEDMSMPSFVLLEVHQLVQIGILRLNKLMT